MGHMRPCRCWAIAVLALAACGGSENNVGAATYTVGGTLTGLSGTIVLVNNGGDDLTLTENGSFTFATAVAQGAAYDVAVKTQPAGQTCSVASGSGTMGNANVTSVVVTCAANSTVTHTIGGTLSDLSGTVVLTNNGGDDLTATQDGSFTFATAIPEGVAYDVEVKTQPAGQTCSVANGSGTVGSANVTNVAVTCAASSMATHIVGGTVNGLWGTVVLTNNGGDDQSVTRFVGSPSLDLPISFTFATPIAENGSYAVEVKTDPNAPYQTCAVSNGTGTVGTADVTNVQVTCTGFGAACTMDDDCSGDFGICRSVTQLPNGCTKVCGTDDECPVGSNGSQKCNNSGFCRW
jgi:hypothetical protein